MSRVVSRGAIRVDARRAVSKLREHLLVDLHLYLLELVRAAVAAGATAIDLRTDADDLILTCDGRPLDAVTLERLLDHVLDAPRDREGRRARLVALGVNAALGLQPARVDVFTTTAAAGRCARARFTPAVVEAAPGDAAARPACEEVPAPQGMPAEGLRVEVRRKLGWGVLRRAVSGARLPELEHLAAATADLPIPITLDGAPLARAGAPAPLVRVPFHLRGATRAALEILPTPRPSGAGPTELSSAGSGPELDLLEHGVRLLREAWSFAPRFPSTSYGGVSLPVRVIVDAEELPTNASRSALREDAPLRALLPEAALAALLDGLRALAALACGAGAAPEGVVVLSDDREALAEALGAFACVTAGAAGPAEALPEEAQRILALPLLRDGLGRPIAPASLPARVYGWRGREPVPEAASPWAGEIVWLTGRLAERVLFRLQVEDAASIVAQARRGEERRRALYAHAPGEPVVPPSPGQLARAAFAVDEGPCAGLRGEVALRAVDPAAPAPASVRVLFDGRVLDTVTLDRAAVPLPFEAAIAWEGKLRPKLGYEGVERNDGFHAATGHVLRLALLTADREARRLFAIAQGQEPPQREGSDADRDRLRPALRAAVGALVAARAGASPLGERSARSAPRAPVPPEDLDLAAFPGLQRAPVWPTTEPGRFENLQGLGALVSVRAAACFAPPGATGRAPDGRPVFTLRPEELAWIASAFPGASLELVPYERALLAGEDAQRRREEDWRPVLSRALTLIAPPAAAGEAPVLSWSQPWGRALATPADRHAEAWHHALYPLDAPAAQPHFAPIAIAIDSDNVMPDRSWRKVIAGRAPYLVARVERELCEALAALLEGDPAAAERLGVRPPDARIGAAVSTRITAHLIRCAHALARRAAERKAVTRAQVKEAASERELLTRLRKLPLLALLDPEGTPAPASLDDIDAAHPGLIPVLRGAPGFATLDWRPVLVRDERDRDAFLAWSEGRAALADGELLDRRARAEQERTRRAFLAGPAHDVRDVGDLADPPRGTPPPVTVFLPPAPQPPAGAPAALPPAARIPVAAALPRVGVHIEHAWVDVLFTQRALCRRALPLPVPVVARVDLSDPAHIEGFRDVTRAGLDAVTPRVHAAALALASRLLAEASQPGRAAAFFGDARAILLVARLLAPSASPPGVDASRAAPLAEALRSSALLWPTVQGEERPLVALRAAGPDLFFGARVHAPWRGTGPRSDLDAPVLHLPDGPIGDALRALLRALGHGLRDVSAALATLQRRRAADAPPDEAPRLPGAPPHPLLRRTLADLHVREAEGEVELLEGPASEVQLIALDGVPRIIAAQLPLPLRVVARVHHADPSASAAEPLLKRVSKAMGRHLLACADQLDELPLFVRAHLRRALCKTLADGKTPRKEALTAPLFQDTRGAWRSLTTLRDGWKEWACTLAPPPYPSHAYDPPVLCLTPDERSKLAAVQPIRDLTQALARDLEGERRASAPPRPVVALDDATRRRCLAVLRLDDPGTSARGEIGLLLPAHEAHAGIEVLVGRRPLCRLDAGAGWPLVAVVNDDALEPNRHFDAPRRPAAAEQLRARVRAAATSWLEARVEPPADALATRWIQEARGADHARLHIAGRLWLPAEWPTAPRVQCNIPVTDGTLGGPRALSLPVAVKGTSGVLPVSGALLVWPDAAWDKVAEIAMRAVASMVAEIAGARPDDPQVAAYRWNLRLLGASEAGAPTAPDAGGQPIGVSQVLAELSARGCVWVTRGEGSAEGRFPDGAPAFLLADGSPLVHVLRHRGRDLVRELGGLEPPPDPTPRPAPAIARDPARDPAPAPLPDLAAAAAPIAPVLTYSLPEPAPASPPPRGAWLAQLWQSVRAVFTGGGAPADTRGESELAAAVHVSLAALRLAGDPVADVAEERTGRPVRYEPRARRVVINPRHDALAWARGRSPRDPLLVALLVAAAVGEINRALESVTDAEERRALDELLRSIKALER